MGVVLWLVFAFPIEESFGIPARVRPTGAGDFPSFQSTAYAHAGG